MKCPLVSVVMPVYNGDRYLREAIESILNQTFTDFEFIIINDGSTDKTEEIILSYDDKRISYVKNESNLKISETLNKGIALAQGEYIARMDADDISYPDRFEKQVLFMEENVDIGVCGTWLRTLGDLNEVWQVPVSHKEISTQMLFNSCLMHPTVFIRKSLLLNGYLYDDDFTCVEDYELWVRLSDKTLFHNIPEVLLDYRISNNSSHRTEYKNNQKKMADIVREKYLNLLKVDCSTSEVKLHNKLSSYDYESTALFVTNTRKWLLKLLKGNPDHCHDVIVNRYYNICRNLIFVDDSYKSFVTFLNESGKRCFKLRTKLFIRVIFLKIGLVTN